jgi:hypothetical protein
MVGCYEVAIFLTHNRHQKQLEIAACCGARVINCNIDVVEGVGEEKGGEERRSTERQAAQRRHKAVTSHKYQTVYVFYFSTAFPRIRHPRKRGG